MMHIVGHLYLPLKNKASPTFSILFHWLVVLFECITRWCEDASWFRWWASPVLHTCLAQTPLSSPDRTTACLARTAAQDPSPHPLDHTLSLPRPETQRDTHTHRQATHNILKTTTNQHCPSENSKTYTQKTPSRKNDVFTLSLTLTCLLAKTRRGTRCNSSLLMSRLISIWANSRRLVSVESTTKITAFAPW